MSEEASEPEHQRLILLNRFISRSRSRAPQEHKPPIHGAAELLQAVGARRKLGFAIEFLGLKDNGELTEEARLIGGRGHDYVALRDYEV